MTRHTQTQHLVLACIASLGIALIDHINSTPVLAQQRPALRIMPHCQDYRSNLKVTDEGIESIDGVLTEEFFEAFKHQLNSFGLKPHPTEPRHFSVPWGREPEPSVLVEATLLTVHMLIIKRPWAFGPARRPGPGRAESPTLIRASSNQRRARGRSPSPFRAADLATTM